LDKDTLRSKFDSLKSDDIDGRNSFMSKSGGSTGEPINFIIDRQYRDWRTAVKLLDDLWTGFSRGDRRILLWGSLRDYFRDRAYTGGRSLIQESLRLKLRRWLRNEVWLNSFLMSPATMNDYVKKIDKFQPKQILGYVESVYELAVFIEENNLKVYSPGAIITSAGVLYPHMRKTIESVFNAPVFNRYGSREVGDIACECSYHTGLHVSALTHYVEIIKPDGSFAEPGEIGEIVVTALTNYSMPLIRYQISDFASWSKEQCPCKRGLPLIKNILGRTSDTFVKKDGSAVSGIFFVPVLVEHSGWVKQFQIIQEKYNYIRILLVLKNNSDDPYSHYAKELESISNKIKMVMGKECKIDYEFVAKIIPAASGKKMSAISNVRK
jgi:phenylacetate-CoA ligase